MKFKKWMLLLVMIVGLTSCSSDTEEGNSSEITYADVKPTQTKFKAFYGTKLSKISGSVASKSSEVNPTTEISKPISVIFYPRTQTISFSNIFDNTTVEYKVTGIVENEISVTYSFKINTDFTCTIVNKTSTSPAKAIITFSGGYYQFDVTDSAKKNLTQLVTKETYTAQNSNYNYTIDYSYADTTLIQSVRHSINLKTLQPLTTVTDYTYNEGKLVSKIQNDGNGVLKSKTVYEYTNNLITKSTVSNAAGKVTEIDTFEYNSNGKLSVAYYGNSTGTMYYMIRHYSYEKNKLNTIYTDPEETYKDSEISIYDSERKPYLIAQDEILDPFLYLNITKTTITDIDGVVTNFPEIAYEYSSQGLLVKTSYANENGDPDIKVRTYKEE
ncbi:hypothetical protein [Flavobacterium circumlabens]|uniref:DUF4595 domain-containing protein n=2 Tax=Flavobacterium circumlabens TaxID=2133765 RepID=A0ABY2AY95_9FLAO|nr:hypothetical protein [Flavobacterium circumlabens]TCN57417.1 hypothetical protein EV142_10473 [Flavobacterium circumlabens]